MNPAPVAGVRGWLSSLEKLKGRSRGQTPGSLSPISLLFLRVQPPGELVSSLILVWDVGGGWNVGYAFIFLCLGFAFLGIVVFVLFSPKNPLLIFLLLFFSPLVLSF